MFDMVRKKSAEYGFCVDGLQSEFVLLVKTVGHQIHIFEFAERQIFDMFLFVTKKETFRLPVRPEITKLLFFCVFIDVIRKILRVTETQADLVSVFRGSSEISALAWISEAESRNSFVHTVWI